MARYALRTRTTVATTTSPCYELRTGANKRVALMELHIFLVAATASLYGLGRPAAIGITPTSPVTVLAEDPAEAAGTATTAVAWGTAPTVPANFLRTVQLAAAVGGGIILTFGPKGIIIPVSSSLVLWNITACSASTDIICVVEE